MIIKKSKLIEMIRESLYDESSIIFIEQLCDNMEKLAKLIPIPSSISCMIRYPMKKSVQFETFNGIRKYIRKMKTSFQRDLAWSIILDVKLIDEFDNEHQLISTCFKSHDNSFEGNIMYAGAYDECQDTDVLYIDKEWLSKQSNASSFADLDPQLIEIINTILASGKFNMKNSIDFDIDLE